ncbi:MAG: MBOAT family O-acyltransferase [Ilumatobacteraceae bacterium]
MKKVIISSYVFKEVVEPVFANPKGFGGLDNLLAAYGYSIQIYCDFSGYTDIAIGLALLLGIQFPQNFDSPYRSITLQDFWRRWHMSLSRWLRDYLYIGLGGNRKGTVRTYLNLFLTMFIGGIWHGANWTFIIWGSIHGAVLVAERFLTEAYGEPRSRAMDVVRWFVTFHVVTLAWIFFNARSASVAFEVLGKILGLLVFQPGDPSQFVSLTLVVVIVRWSPSSSCPADAACGGDPALRTPPGGARRPPGRRDDRVLSPRQRRRVHLLPVLSPGAWRVPRARGVGSLAFPRCLAVPDPSTPAPDRWRRATPSWPRRSPSCWSLPPAASACSTGRVGVAMPPVSTSAPRRPSRVRQPMSRPILLEARIDHGGARGTDPAQTSTTAAATTTTDGAPQVPTAQNPAKVYVAGDSDAGNLGPPLQGILEDTGVVTSKLFYKVSSGLTRPDFFDWPAQLQRDIPDYDPDIVVVTFGGNDAQDLTIDGRSYPVATQEWQDEYARRVGAVMDYLSADGRTLVWVGIPTPSPARSAIVSTSSSGSPKRWRPPIRRSSTSTPGTCSSAAAVATPTTSSIPATTRENWSAPTTDSTSTRPGRRSWPSRWPRWFGTS